MVTFVQKQNVPMLPELRRMAVRIHSDCLICRDISLKPPGQVVAVICGSYSLVRIPPRVGEFSLALIFKRVPRNNPADSVRDFRDKVLCENHGNEALSTARRNREDDFRNLPASENIAASVHHGLLVVAKLKLRHWLLLRIIQAVAHPVLPAPLP